ncbi:MAG: Rho termination factor N-terminal domain-containing protein, partial [Pseudonocardiaceae bacterium]
MSDTDLLGENLSAAASSAERPVEQAEMATDNGAAPRRRGGLSGMVMADLRQLAGQLGISDTAGMRKGDLISAIKERQGAAPDRHAVASDQLPLEAPATEQQPAPTAAASDSGDSDRGAPPDLEPSRSVEPAEQPVNAEQQGRDQQDREQEGGDRARNRRRRSARGGELTRSEGDQNQGDQNQGEQRNGNQGEQRGGQNQGGSRDDDDEGGRRRGRRFRDRNRRTRGERPDRREGGELEVREDDVLLPVAGILDVLDNYAFVRTSGYLSGPNDVYVSLSLVRKYGLRRGDAITGAVRQPREGEQQRQKFNPLVRVDTINGLDAEEAKHRPEFTKLTPLYPNERLRLETEQHQMTTRVIDLVMPIGKGQRALIVSPPKAG